MLLSTAGSIGAESNPQPRVVKFGDGSAVITGPVGDEQVEMRNADGTSGALSVCQGRSGSYDQIVAFAKTVRELLSAGNREALAELAYYPLRVNIWGSKPRYLHGERELLAHYDEVFTPSVVKRARELQPYHVFCKDDMAMLGNGVMWVQEDEAHQLRIAVINVGTPTPSGGTSNNRWRGP